MPVYFISITLCLWGCRCVFAKTSSASYQLSGQYKFSPHQAQWNMLHQPEHTIHAHIGCLCQLYSLCCLNDNHGRKSHIWSTTNCTEASFYLLKKFELLPWAVPVEHIASRGGDISDLGLTAVASDLLPGWGALAWFLPLNHLYAVS